MCIALLLVLASLVVGQQQRGYYDLQLHGAIGSATFRRLQRLVGYEAHEFLPPNGLRIWLESGEQVATLLAGMTHVRSLTLQDARPKTRNHISQAIGSLRTQYRRSLSLRANNTAESGGAEALSFNPDSAEARNTNFLPLSENSFEYDEGENGPLTVRLRVRAHNVSNVDDLLSLARPACRTRVVMRERTDHAVLLAGVHCDDAVRVSEELMNDPRVAGVDLQVPYHVHNRWSKASVQTDNGRVPLPSVLDGRNQILSISDTGVQTTTCFFQDPQGIRIPSTNVQAVPLDTHHRKIRAYWSGVGGDLQDTGSAALGAGHGTHVAGTAVGAAQDHNAAQTNLFNGGAPAARLAIIDLLPASQRSGFLAVPLDIGSTLLRWSYDVGARIHSGSWGGDAAGRYSADEQAIDLFTYKNRNMLILFAAGNDGPRPGSISSPSFAKNALSIGATMNGIESVRLAQQPSRPASDYTHDWVAPYSSRGARTQLLRKPDVVAPGGPYVWSAASDGASNGACTSFTDSTNGLAGTSMATPAVAGGAVVLRQYFVDGLYPNSLNISRSIVDTSDPTGSLLRAILVASAQPMLGAYPLQAFRSTQERIETAGHGRVSLAAVLESTYVQLVVLSNENSQHGLARQRQWRWCVEVVDKRTGKVVTGKYGQVAIAMSYADYPATPQAFGNTLLVNDLRLSVTDWETQYEWQINEQNEPERRSTNERTVIDGKRFSITVSADTIAVGDEQTFSLVVVLQRAVGAENVMLRVSDEPTTSPNDRCALCEITQKFGLSSDCSTCGNGIVERPLEQCDSTVCCDSHACKPLNDRSQCTVMAGDCRLRGQCVAGACVVSDADKYGVIGNNGVCGTLPQSTGTQCVHRTAESWRGVLRASVETRQMIDKNDWQLCCAPLWAAMEQIEFEALFADLAREYVAAKLNVVQPGAANTPALLLDIETARLLLEDQCGIGFIDTHQRGVARELSQRLQKANSMCSKNTTATPTPTDACASDARDILRLNELLCSSGGVYDRASSTCACHSNRQPTEPDCAHLACSGNGASLFDYEASKPLCVCLSGWTGATCSQCATLPNTKFVWHCLGMPLALLTDASVPKHVPIIVERTSVLSRAVGKFYGARAAAAKITDASPGTGELDCWCRTNTERLDWRSYESHAAAVQASITQQNLLGTYAARALVVIANPGVSSDGDSVSVAASSQQTTQPLYIGLAIVILCL